MDIEIIIIHNLRCQHRTRDNESGWKLNTALCDIMFGYNVDASLFKPSSVSKMLR